MASGGKLTLPILSPRVWLVVVALLVAGLVFAPLYLAMAIYPWLPHSFSGPPPMWYSALGLLNFGRDLLFSDLARYLVVSLLGIGTAAVALLWARPYRIVQALLVLALLAILVFPWIYEYQPGLVAAPGYAMRVPTHPGFMGGVVKRAQDGAEQVPCKYELLGWDVTNILFYQATCGNDPAVTWFYDPRGAIDDPHVTPRAPGGLARDEMLSYEVLDRVRASGVWPPDAEPGVRSIQLRQGSLRSPDGQWVALISRHVYGPEDVVIVRWEPQR
ncbi:MAG: hypothetical protein M1132_12030 [Chloroflexi bacterium]|nr:hypothetical protein [Chloroflexota bacterium]